MHSVCYRVSVVFFPYDNVFFLTLICLYWTVNIQCTTLPKHQSDLFLTLFLFSTTAGHALQSSCNEQNITLTGDLRGCYPISQSDYFHLLRCVAWRTCYYDIFFLKEGICLTVIHTIRSCFAYIQQWARFGYSCNSICCISVFKGKWYINKNKTKKHLHYISKTQTLKHLFNLSICLSCQ